MKKTAHDSFLNVYNQLNERQKEAVDAIDGPVMVIAGPGTGKTQILSVRIANIIRRTDTSPDAILAISFTESAASAMRARLVAIMGEAGYRVHIHTFHSFCNSCIQKYPEAFPDHIGSEPITEVEQTRLVSGIVMEGSYELLRPRGNPIHYVSAIIRAIQGIKREGYTPEQFIELVTEEESLFESRDDLYHTTGAHAGKIKGIHQDTRTRIRKNKELANIYRQYQEHLQHSQWYDFDDMIIEVIRACKRDEDFLRTIQETYQYFLIDEHQDTNNAQNELIALLCNFDIRPNIFLVGDEKQAIYRFQGASFENFMRMKERYPDTRIIVLEENYRSSQYILDATHGVGEHITKNPAQLYARADHANIPIHIQTYHTDEEELQGIAAAIATRIAHGTSPQNIAILYRENKDAQMVARALEKAGVPYSIESDQDALTQPLVQNILSLLHVVINPLHDEHVIQVLHQTYTHITVLDAFMIIATARKRKKHIIQIIKSIAQGTSTETYENIDAIQQLYIRIMRWIRMKERYSAMRCIDTIVHESGLLRTGTDMIRHEASWRALKRVYREWERVYEKHPDNTIEDLVQHILFMKERGIALPTGPVSVTHAAVRCMTAHKSKGMEFPIVYIVRVYDGRWGNKRVANILPLIPRIYTTTPNTLDEPNEDRRLFYVALTRGKHEVCISWAQYDSQGRERLMSVYVSELRPDMCVYKTIPAQDNSFNISSESIISQHNSISFDAVRMFLWGLLQEKGISVTAFNNYRTCPWRYVYVNLLGVPQVQQIHQMYGTAIHAALHDVALITKKDIHDDRVQYAINQFKKHLKKNPISDHEYVRLCERGTHALTQFLHIYTNALQKTKSAELRIRGIQTETPNITLNGIIDHIYVRDDGYMCVTDYKTGTHKSRADIEGRTQSSSGNIIRQLIFYAILLDAHTDKHVRMDYGSIAFVEPDEKNICHIHEFTITPDQITALKADIHAMIEAIQKLSFWDTHCDDVSCPYCKLRFTEELLCKD